MNNRLEKRMEKLERKQIYFLKMFGTMKSMELISSMKFMINAPPNLTVIS